jgi:hypothetical protein
LRTDFDLRKRRVSPPEATTVTVVITPCLRNTQNRDRTLMWPWRWADATVLDHATVRHGARATRNGL